jgi:hypothetical protein
MHALAVQVWLGPHCAQTLPAIPQARRELPGWQNPFPSQQPPQLAGPHDAPTHVPFEQVSTLLQEPQVSPFAPHTVTLWLANVTHVWLGVQQPEAQLCDEQPEPPVQTPPVQVWPFPHRTQAEPPWLLLPHWLSLSLATATHAPALEQQPPGQVEALHPPLQRPLAQLWPRPQATQRAPAAAVWPHWLVFSLAVVTQLPPLVQQPAQLDAVQPVVDALQLPSWQTWLEAQAAQLPPLPPQALAVLPIWQTPLESQQPWGQMDALHLGEDEHPTRTHKAAPAFSASRCESFIGEGDAPYTDPSRSAQPERGQTPLSTGASQA